jgi:hypothetical protein
MLDCKAQLTFTLDVSKSTSYRVGQYESPDGLPPYDVPVHQY